MASLTRFAYADRARGSSSRLTGAILAAVAGIFIAAPVLASVNTPTDCLPPRGGPPYNAPPYDGKYRTADEVHADFPGLVVDQVEHTIYQRVPGGVGGTPCTNPPTVLNVPDIENFSSDVSGRYSLFSGPPTPFLAPAPCQVKVTLTQVNGDTRTFQTEMLSLDLSGGTLPAGVMIRESPTLASTGQTKIRATSKGGYVIDSFFDIFVEVSLDGGQTWAPENNGPTHVELTGPAPAVPGVSFPWLALLVLLLIGTGVWIMRGGRVPARAGALLAIVAGIVIAAPALASVQTPTDCLPPRGGPPYDAPPYDGKYRTAEEVHADFPGLVIDQVEHTIFQETPCNSPPTVLFTPSIENFNSNVSGRYSLFSGPPTPFSAPAPCVARVTLTQINGDTRVFQTEMLSMNLSGGTLPAGVRIRESPTLQSTGQTRIRASSKSGYIIDSFFDIFVEVSLDGGQTWTPETNGPTHVELSGPAPAVPGVSFPWLALLVLLLIGTGVWIIRAGTAPARA